MLLPLPQKLRHLLRLCLCLVVFWSIAPAALATHLRAGNIFATSDTAAHPNPNKYYFKLVTYSVAPSPPAMEELQATLYFGDCTSQTVDRAFRVELPGQTNLPGGQNRTYVNVYYFSHTYSGAGTFTVTYMGENRNAGIVNLAYSVQKTFLLQSTVTIDALLGANHSPVFTTHPIHTATTNSPFYHTLGAYDAEGDSLAYKLIASKTLAGQQNCGEPMAGAVPGFRSLDEFLGTPVASNTPVYSLDAESGLLTWDTPSTQGEFNVTILVEEWRYGRLIGTTTRDMQILVYEGNRNPYLLAGEDQLLPLGSSITLGAAPLPDIEYLWEPTLGLSDPAVANPTLTLTRPQKTAYVLISFEKRTGIMTMDAVQVTVVDPTTPPATPVITLLSGDTLLAGSADLTYQWRKDGNILPEATSARLKPTAAGLYAARTQSATGTFSAWSANFLFQPTVTGLSDELKQAIRFYPNPASTALQVQAPSPLQLQTATVFTTLGQHRATLIPQRTSCGWVIPLQSLPNGLYLLYLTTDQGSLVHQLLIAQ